MAAQTVDPASLRTSRRRFLIATASSAALPAVARTVSSESARAKEFRDSGGAANVSLRVNCKEHRVSLDVRSTPGFMRSPPMVRYMYALETAMDELAVKLGMDPIELRRVNDTMTEPIEGKPFSSRSLMKCYDQAADSFGWAERDPHPGSMRKDVLEG